MSHITVAKCEILQNDIDNGNVLKTLKQIDPKFELVHEPKTFTQAGKTVQFEYQVRGVQATAIHGDNFMGLVKDSNGKYSLVGDFYYSPIRGIENNFGKFLIHHKVEAAAKKSNFKKISTKQISPNVTQIAYEVNV